MDDARKTKAQLIAELRQLREQIGELERVQESQVTHKTELCARLDLYQTAFRQAGAIPYRIDWAARTYTFASGDIYAFTGYGPAELTFDRLQSMPVEAHLTGPLQGLTHDEAHERIRKGELKEWSCDYRIITRDGEEKWISDRSVELYNAVGKHTESIGLFRDITERKRAEIALRESEERYRALYTKTPVMLHSIDRQGRIVSVSDHWLKVMGYERHEVIGRKSTEFLTPPSRLYAEEVVLPAYFGTGSCTNVAYQFVKKNGEIIDVLLSATAERDTDGNVVRSLAVLLDVTERKQVEETLRESEERYRQLVEFIPDGIVVHAESRIEFANSTALRITGASSSADLLGKSVYDFIHPDYHEVTRGRLRILNSAGTVTPVIEEKLLRVDGTSFVAEVEALSFRDKGRIKVLAVLRDITERKQAEDALRESEERFRKVFDEGPVGMAIVSLDLRFIRVNRALSKMLGYTPEQLQKLGIRGITHPDDWLRGQELADRMLRGEIPLYQLEKRYLAKNGDIVWGLLTTAMVCDNQGNPWYSLRLIEDITARKTAQEALRRSEERFRALVQNASDITAILELDGTLRYESPAFFRTLGYTEADIIGISAFELIHPDDLPKAQKAYQEVIQRPRVSLSEEFRCRKADGGYVHLEVSAINLTHLDAICGVIVNARDITERRRAEEERSKLENQIMHAQKLESLGVLAGGIAHDFNNLLTGILGNADLALMELSPVSPARSSIEQIVIAARRAAELAKQMLAYSGKGKFVIQSIQLCDVVQEMAHLLQVSISKKCVLRYRFEPNLPPVEGDPTQIRQVVMNLIINAAEAIGEQSGVIAVGTGVMECDRAYLSESYLDENLPEGLYVYLEVADSGCGMTEDIKAKLFDPFFTTKFTGRGLGLAVVLGITRGHHGVIKVYSEPGRGTTFKVLFPAAQHRPEAATPQESERGKAWLGGGLVLVVDDEETVRTLAKIMLERAGFTVLTAGDGREGVELFRAHADEIRAVLLDMTMPRMGGEEAFREIRRIRNDARVVLTSGYAEEDVTDRFAGKGLAGFIQKPYRAEELRNVMRGALGVKSEE